MGHFPLLRARPGLKRGPRAGTRLFLADLEGRTLLSVPPSTNFGGLNFSDTAGYVPPDTIAAAGPNHVVEAVNLSMRIYSKSGTILSTQDLSTLFSSVNPVNLSDPVVMYDESAGRFVIGAIDYNGSATY